MKQLPSLKQLKYFVALAETRHFGKAAERCIITPSTLSAGIRDLEAVLGVPLAERSKRHVHITPFGIEIARRAQFLLRDVQDIMELAISHQQPMTGNIRMGVIPTISPFLLPPALSSLNEKFPQLCLFPEEELTDRLLDRLHQGEIDIALIAMPYDVRGFSTDILFEDEFLFACNQQHPLSSKRSISVNDLQEENLLLLEEGHCLRSHVLEACKLEQHRGRSGFEASSYHTLVLMVTSGLGVTLLPKLAIDAAITKGTNIKLMPLVETPSRQIGLVWRESSPRKHEFEQLGAVIREQRPGSISS